MISPLLHVSPPPRQEDHRGGGANTLRDGLRPMHNQNSGFNPSLQSLFHFPSAVSFQGSHCRRQVGTAPSAAEAAGPESCERCLRMYSSETVPLQSRWGVASPEKNPHKCSSFLMNRQFSPQKVKCYQMIQQDTRFLTSRQGSMVLNRSQDRFLVDLSSDRSSLVIRVGSHEGYYFYMCVYTSGKFKEDAKRSSIRLSTNICLLGARHVARSHRRYFRGGHSTTAKSLWMLPWVMGSVSY